MCDEKVSSDIRRVRDRARSSALLPTEREVLLARVCLYLCDRIGWDDADQDFLELYNSLKSLAEGVVRHGNA